MSEPIAGQPPCLFILTSRTRRSRRSGYGDVRYHLRTYLDETGKIRLSSGTERRDTTGLSDPSRPVIDGTREAEGLGRVILPAGWFRGQLTAGGYFADWMMLDDWPRRSNGHALQRSRWVDQVSRHWSRVLSGHRTFSKEGALTRNNFSLSLSGDITRRLTLAGISAPDFLERVLECALARYMRENGYDADDSLGYVYGFHMDTAYLHIQMSVCPRTAKGVLVKVTPMVRDKGGPERVFGPGFRNPMTRYACEAAHELERELLGRDHLELRTARDMAKSLFRSHRVFAAFGDEQDRKKLYTELEDHAVTAYARESGCPAELLVELKVLLRRYAGVPDGELGAPRVDYTAPEHGPAARRLSRLWLSLAYAELENTERKMESRQSSGNAVSPPATAGTPGLPANLLPVYHAFWQRARQGAAPVQSMRNLVRQKRMVAVRDMDRELPDAARLRELFLAHKKSLGGWFENFVAWLDRHVLFGSGVYYSKLGLEELEYAVRSRVAAVPFLGGKAIGVPSKRSGESSAPAREPAIESEKTPETGPDSEEPPGRLPG